MGVRERSMRIKMGQVGISAPVVAGLVATLLAGALTAADGGAKVRGTAQFSANWEGGRLVAGSTGFEVVNREGLTAVVGIAGAASRQGVTDAHDGSVTFPGVSPGLGVRYYVRNGRPEYDFLVERGARPEDIRLDVQTHGSLALDSSGDLIVSDGRSVVAFSRPLAYQVIGGRRCAVDASYILRGSTAGFSVSSYDRTRELVIDPAIATEVLAWSYPRLGSDAGISTQSANAIATDSQGNVYATGMTAANKGYIIEIPANGGTDSTRLILDSGGYTVPTAIAVDASGYIYVTGYANGANLPVTTGPGCCTSTANAFLLKFAPSALNGSTNPGAFYGTYFGGSNITKPLGIAVNNSGIVWITGETNSYDFPHPNSSISYGGGTGATFDAFAAEFDSVGGTQLYGRFLGGNNTSFGTSIAFDSNGVDFAGGTQATNVPVTSGAWQSSGSGNTDGFFLRLNPTTPDSATYGTYIQNGQVNGLALSNGHVYLTGQVGSGLFFKSTSGNQTSSGGDAYVMQFNGATPAVVAYAELFGGSANDFGTGIAADSTGNAYVIGTTSSSGTIGSGGSLPAGIGAAPLQSTYNGGSFDVFYARFDSAGTLQESTYLGGSGQDVSGSGFGSFAVVPAGGIAIASNGQVYLAGDTNSPNFPKQSGASGTGAFVGALTVENPGGPLSFVPVTPCRIADTRNTPDGPFAGPILAGGTSRAFVIPNSACGIPSTAVAYSLNVTVVPQSTLGYISIWPTGKVQPVVSTLNSLDGRIKANAAIVPAGTNGAVSVFATNNTQLVLDIDGYFVPSTVTSALGFYPLPPCRVADTRNSTGSLGGPALQAAQTRTFPILSSSCSVPSTALAYSVNVTAVPKTTLGYISIWPTGQSKPTVSTLNALTGAITANAAIVPSGTSGSVNVYATDNTDFILDINGYFAPRITGALSLYTLTPCRALDTRQPVGSAAFSGTIQVNVVGSLCGASAAANAFVLNATVVPPSPLGYLTLWPAGISQPIVSTLNAFDGALTSNMAIVPAGSGSISAYADSSTYLILDLSGYFAP